MPQLCPIFWSMFPFLMFVLLLIIFSYMEYTYKSTNYDNGILFSCKFKWFW